MKSEEENERNNKRKPGYYIKRAIFAAFEILTAYIAIACSPAKADDGLANEQQQVTAKVSSTPTATQTNAPTSTQTVKPSPSPTPSLSPTQLPMDVDLGLTESKKNSKRMINSVYFINVTIDSYEYWIDGIIWPVDKEETIWGFKNLNDDNFIVIFDNIDLLLNYLNGRGDIGSYKADKCLAVNKDFKVNEILSIDEYKNKYAKNVITDFDYMFINSITYAKYQNDDVTYEQLDEFYRETVDREKWFIPSERYVKKVANSPYTTNSPTVSRNIDKLAPIRFLTNDVSDEEIDGSVKKFSRM